MCIALFLAVAMGTLSVSSDPEAEVLVDAKPIAKTPLKEHAVSAGVHLVRVRTKDKSLDFAVTVRAKRNTSAVVDFASDRIEIVLASEPAPEADEETGLEISPGMARVAIAAPIGKWGTVFIDEKRRDDTPVVAELEPGRHDFVVKWKDGATEHQTLVVEAGKSYQLDFGAPSATPAATPSTKAKLSVVASGGWAYIDVDGKRIGTTPGSFEIAPGAHAIGISMPTKDYTATIHCLVQAGRSYTLTLADGKYKLEAQ